MQQLYSSIHRFRRSAVRAAVVSTMALSALALPGISQAQAAANLSAGPFDISVDKFSNTPFIDIYDLTFGTPPGGTISSSAIEVKLGKFVDIAWHPTQAFSIYSGPGGTGSLLAQFGDPAIGTGSFFVEDLPVSSNLFSVVLKGTPVGTGTSVFQPGLRGHYDLNVIAQPIPEPATVMLMLAGLCGVVGASARKRGNVLASQSFTLDPGGRMIPAA